MKALVVGGGAREHALVRSLLADVHVASVVCAPGNAGIAQDVRTHDLNVSDPEAVARLAEKLAVDLVVIGPEIPLVAGAADAVRAKGIACFGPSKAAAQLEGSKAFAKEIMAAAGVPTAEARVCTNLEQVSAALDEFGATHVVKDDGLAAGKGVVVTDDRDVAIAHARACLDAGSQVVIEAFLDGPEVSLFALCDGSTVVPLIPAQDFKRVGDNDEGPNTGGMGAYTPLSWAPPGLVDEVQRTVLQPTVDELARRGTPFVGLLYAGLAITSRGIRVVEFNARFGDPETQVVLSMLDSPLGGALYAAATGTLDQLAPLKWFDGAAVTVVLAASGYPEKVKTGHRITNADHTEDVTIYHAGTTLHEGVLVSSGGRVLSVTARGTDLADARSKAYDVIAQIGLEGSHYRTDIALNASQ